MDLIFIIGPAASGKMTVGQELKGLTGYKLFYNHLSLELVNQFFDFGTPHFKKLDKKIRFDVFEEIAKSDIQGLIFTMLCAFDDSSDMDYLDEVSQVFKSKKTSYVELHCDLEERLKRNHSTNRLKHKASKRDLEFSEKLLLQHEKDFRMNSLEGEYEEKNILKINNTSLSARMVAEQILTHFNLDRL